MKRQRIQRSQRLPAGLPAIAVECLPAPRLLSLCVVPAALVVIAVLVAPGLPAIWRLFAALVLSVVTIPVIRQLSGAPGAARVRGLVWEESGSWWLADDNGECVRARLRSAAVIGPFVFLRWIDVAKRTRRAALDVSLDRTGSARLLVGRLRIT